MEKSNIFEYYIVHGTDIAWTEMGGGGRGELGPLYLLPEVVHILIGVNMGG